MKHKKFVTADYAAGNAAQDAYVKLHLINLRIPATGGDLKDERSPEALRVAILRQLPRGDDNSPTLETAERLINAWNNANPSQKLQPYVSMVPKDKMLKRVSNTVTHIYLSFHKGWWYALAPRYLEPPGQPPPRTITFPEGLRVNPTQGPLNDGLAELPPDVMFLYPKDATAEEMKRRPKVDLRKGLWGVSAIVVPPGAILKPSQDSSDNKPGESPPRAEERA